MRYFYARVSTQDQNLNRQLEAAKAVYNGEYDEVFCDRRTGANFNRPEYQRMKSLIQPGDEIVIKDLDRLGRNKEALRDELKDLKERGARVRILNIPTTLADFPEGQEWMFDMVNNIMLEVLGAIAQNELDTLHRRMREGIEAMPLDAEGYRISSRTGRRAGREYIEVPQFAEIYSKYKKGEYTADTASEELGISRRKFFNMAKEMKSGLQ